MRQRRAAAAERRFLRQCPMPDLANIPRFHLLPGWLAAIYRRQMEARFRLYRRMVRVGRYF